MLTTTNSVNKLFCYNMISYSQGSRFGRLRLFQSFQVVFFQFFLNVQFIIALTRVFLECIPSKAGSIILYCFTKTFSLWPYNYKST